MNDSKPRFSDEKLQEFHDEFKVHLKNYDERVKVDDARYAALMSVCESNASSTRSLADSTRDIVNVYDDLKGAARVGTKIQSFGIWLAKWGMIGGAAAYVWKWVITHIPSW